MKRITIGVASAALTLALAAPAGAFYDRDCSDFPTQRAAQKFFKKHNPRQDPHGLDADHDGIACESNS